MTGTAQVLERVDMGEQRGPIGATQAQHRAAANNAVLSRGWLDAGDNYASTPRQLETVLDLGEQHFGGVHLVRRIRSRLTDPSSATAQWRCGTRGSGCGWGGCGQREP